MWWFILCKDAFRELWATSSLHTIIHTFKNTWFKSNGVRVFILFFFHNCFYNLVTSMMELLDSLVILQVECQKYHFWINIKLFFEIKMPDQFFFKTQIGKLIFGKKRWIASMRSHKASTMCLWIFIRKLSQKKWIMLIVNTIEWQTHYFHWNFRK